jgi:hypothetical protein
VALALIIAIWAIAIGVLELFAAFGAGNTFLRIVVKKVGWQG